MRDKSSCILHVNYFISAVYVSYITSPRFVSDLFRQNSRSLEEFLTKSSKKRSYAIRRLLSYYKTTVYSWHNFIAFIKDFSHFHNNKLFLVKINQ